MESIIEIRLSFSLPNHFGENEDNEIGIVINREKEGFWRTFSKNGELVSEGYFYNGMADGIWEAHLDEDHTRQLWKNGECISLDLDGKYFCISSNPFIL